MREGIPYFYRQRRYKKGSIPNPYCALSGCDWGKIRYNIIIPPRGLFSFPFGSIEPTERYDYVEYRIKFLKNGQEYREWIRCRR